MMRNYVYPTTGLNGRGMMDGYLWGMNFGQWGSLALVYRLLIGVLILVILIEIAVLLWKKISHMHDCCDHCCDEMEHNKHKR